MVLSSAMVRAAARRESAFLGQKLSPGLENGARQFFLQAFQTQGISPTEAELQGVMSVAKHESSFGRGWKPGSPMDGSHNMGAIQCCQADSAGNCPTGSALQGDTHPDGTKYTVCFKTYPDDVAGAADIIRTLYKRKGVPEALRAGSSYRLAEAMFLNSYFEGTCQKGDPPGTGTGKERFCAAEPRIRRYAETLFTAAKDSSAVTGVPLAVSMSKGSSSGGIVSLVAAVGLGAAGFYLLRTYMKRSGR